MTESSDEFKINYLIETLLDEIFSYLSLEERIRNEVVCKKWRQILANNKSQRVIKFYFKSIESTELSELSKLLNLKKQTIICSNRSHYPTTTDLFYFDANLIDLNAVSKKIDGLFNKFQNLKSIHLQCKDIHLLKKSSLLTSLSRYASRLVHFEIDLFKGPFTINELKFLIKSWSKHLKHLVIKFQCDNGETLSGKTIMKFFEICPNLELFYWKAPYLTDQTFEYTPINLTTLILFDTTLDMPTLKLLAKVNGEILKQLKLSNITGEQFNFVTSKFKFLTSLSVDAIIHLHDLNSLREIDRLQRLEVLNFWLDNDSNNIDNQFASIIKGCNMMRRVHIENAIISDQCLVLMSKYCKNLASFKLYTSSAILKQITDLSLIEFLKLKHLATLAIPNQFLSKDLLIRLINKSKFSCLILRETCDFMEDLFNQMHLKASQAHYNRYMLKYIHFNNFINSNNIKLDCISSNLQFKMCKVFTFDL